VRTVDPLTISDRSMVGWAPSRPSFNHQRMPRGIDERCDAHAIKLLL